MLVKNYRPISFLPILGKMFERVIYKPFSTVFKIIDFSHLSNLVFFQFYSCIAQLLSIIHEIQMLLMKIP